jgi:excisionase family DNA binding protein
MTIDEVASELRCSVRHIHNLMRRGHLRFLRHGGKMVRIHRASVEHYIAEWSMGGE